MYVGKEAKRVSELAVNEILSLVFEANLLSVTRMSGHAKTGYSV